MMTKNRAGKVTLSVPKGGTALQPVAIDPDTEQQVVAVTNQGRMLVFPLTEVPELSRGKGNKLINVPTAAFKSREEYMIAVRLLGPDDELLVYAGQRHLRMKARDLEHYVGERARRGRKLPRGFQKVDSLEVAGGSE
jgi:topoisomerase-4 subunit A